MSNCCSYGSTADQKFNAKRAAGDLASYREKGPNPTTRLLRDGLVQSSQQAGSPLEGSLLDVGGGIGALTFELLDRGIARATVVEASSPFFEAASGEAARRGRAVVVQLVHGDFLDVASSLPDAHVVTLDRVICCHPAYEAMLGASLRHAQRYFAFSYPRDEWHMHAAFWMENSVRRLKSETFRAFVHPARKMEEIIQDAGFQLTIRRKTLFWCADVYARIRQFA